MICNKNPLFRFGTGDVWLSAFTEEEDCQHAGTYMGTGNRLMGTEEQLFGWCNGANLVSKQLCILQTVAMRNGNNLISGIYHAGLVQLC